MKSYTGRSYPGGSTVYYGLERKPAIQELKRLFFVGEWCETEIDECLHTTCSPITDCVDLIGSARCDVNAVKMAAIILCSVMAVCLLVFLILRKYKKKNNKVSDSWYGIYFNFFLM